MFKPFLSVCACFLLSAFSSLVQKSALSVAGLKPQAPESQSLLNLAVGLVLFQQLKGHIFRSLSPTGRCFVIPLEPLA